MPKPRWSSAELVRDGYSLNLRSKRGSGDDVWSKRSQRFVWDVETTWNTLELCAKAVGSHWTWLIRREGNGLHIRKCIFLLYFFLLLSQGRALVHLESLPTLACASCYPLTVWSLCYPRVVTSHPWLPPQSLFSALAIPPLCFKEV